MNPGMLDLGVIGESNWVTDESIAWIGAACCGAD